MAEKVDLQASGVRASQRQVSNYGTQTPLSSAAVDRGSTRWLNGSNVEIDGLLSVSGTLSGGGDFDWTGGFTQSGPSTFTGSVDLNGPVEVAGDTNVTGTFTVTGPTSLEGVTEIVGDTTVTGTFDVDGPMTTTGTLDVEGVTTLKNDLNVTTGKIVAAGLTIDPAVDGGSVIFAGGGGMQGVGGVTAVKGFGNAGLITGTTASLFAVGVSLDVSSAAVTVNGGPLRVPGMTFQAGGANVRYDASTGQLYYTT